MRFRACENSPSGKNPRRAFGEFRRVRGVRRIRGIKKKEPVSVRMRKKISSIIQVRNHLIKSYKKTIIKKRILNSIILSIYFIIILYVTRKEQKE